MTLHVTDPRSNANDQIEHAVRTIGRSVHCLDVFKAIYAGKVATKTVASIMTTTGLSQVRVLQVAAHLANNGIVTKARKDGHTEYGKDPFFTANRNKIISYVKRPEKLKNLPTKSRPQLTVKNQQAIVVPRSWINAKRITLDDIDSFNHVKRTHSRSGFDLSTIPEKKIKSGFQSIIGEHGVFKDWPGEKGDIYSTRLVFKKRRLATAIQLKGPGKRGVLTPGKLGTNGDQIQRLFESDADIFLIQYWGQIAESVPLQMRQLAEAKSVREQRLIMYGIIDGQDTDRLMRAYPKAF